MPAYGRATSHFVIAAMLSAGVIAIAGLSAVAGDELPQLSLKQEAVFARPASWMSACPLYSGEFIVPHRRIELMERDRRYDGASTLSISPEDGDGAVMWRLVVGEIGENSSHVRLFMGPSTTERDQSKVWIIVQSCSETPKQTQSTMPDLRKLLQIRPPPYPAPDMPLDCCHSRST